ncbi:MAG: hypothetical protein NVS3B24_10960 [Candidatus Dormibacteria bacterium]
MSDNDPRRPDHISKEVWDIMTSAPEAVSHHWVPRMILRNFTLHPDGQDPEIWCQPVGRGAPRLSRVGAECVIGDHNTLTTGVLPAQAIEGLYGRIESDAAPIVRQLLAGEAFNEDGRRAMSYLIAVQHVRTPRARSEQRFVAEKAATTHALLEAQRQRQSLIEGAREHLARRDGVAPAVDQGEAFVDAAIAGLEQGTVLMRAPHDMDAGLGLLGANELAEVIYGMAWTGMRVEDIDLIIGDHPLLIHDPAAGTTNPSAWMSSRQVQAFFPLSAGFCLLMEHGGAARSYREGGITADAAERINLASMAHAWRGYYGPTQACVQAARELGKRRRADLEMLRPVARGLVLGHRVEGEPEPFRVDVHRAPRQVKVSRGRRGH